MLDVFVDGYGDKWYMAWPDGTRCEYFPKTYKRAQDAKTELTKFNKRLK